MLIIHYICFRSTCHVILFVNVISIKKSKYLRKISKYQGRHLLTFENFISNPNKINSTTI